MLYYSDEDLINLCVNEYINKISNIIRFDFLCFTDYFSLNICLEWISFNDSIKSVVISYGVGFIGNNAFSNCIELSSISIPNSVISIGNFAFSNCLNLISVTYNGINDPGIDSNAFDNCNKLIKVNVPANYNGNTFCGKNIIRMQNEPTVTNSNTVIIAIIVSVAVILIITGITVAIRFHKKSTIKYEDENVQF